MLNGLAFSAISQTYSVKFNFLMSDKVSLFADIVHRSITKHDKSCLSKKLMSRTPVGVFLTPMRVHAGCKGIGYAIAKLPGARPANLSQLRFI